MTAARCGAQPETIEGSRTPVCRLHVDGHGERHKGDDGTEWDTCSQHCIANHVHGRYRRKLGGAIQSAAARIPKRDKARKRGGPQCSACLESRPAAELEHGRCKDREACQARQPQLEIGMEGQ